MKKNIRILIILPVLILLLTVLSTYIAFKYTSKNTIKTTNTSSVVLNDTTDNEINSSSEVELGETYYSAISHCTEYEYYCSEKNIKDGFKTLSGTSCVKTYTYTRTTKTKQDDCKGKWSSDGTTIMGSCTIEYTQVSSRAAERKCVKCNSAYYLSGGSCKVCHLKADKSFAVGNRKVISPGDEFCGVAQYEETNVDGCTADIQYSPSKCIKPTASDSCGYINIKAYNRASSITLSAYVYGDWEGPYEGLYKGKLVDSKEEADVFLGSVNKDPKTEYSKGGKCEEDTKDTGYYYCTNVFRRGACGTKAIQTYDYCCVNNQFVGVSKKVVWAEHKLKNNTKTFNACAYYYGEGYTVAEGIKKEQCKVTEDVPDRCNASIQVIGSVNESTKACEEEHTTNVSEGEVCSGTDFKTKGTDINNTFYTITCDKTITTNFDYGDDGIKDTPNELLRGQGFKYGITVTTKSQCIGDFDGDKWTDTYKKLWAKVTLVNKGLVNSCSDFSKTGLDKCDKYIKGMKVNNENVRKDVYKLLNIIRELVDIVNTYNDYEPTTDTDESATISFTYLANGITKEVNTNFVREDVSKGNYVSIKETTVKIGDDPSGKVKGLTNPKDYTRNNYSSPRVTKLIPPKVSINRINGVDVYVEEKEKEKENNNTSNDIQKVDGGNKIYLDYGADIQTISPITIKVSGLGGGKSTVTNNKCKLKIQDTDLLYRPIDVGNPFINNEWKKGQNWVNETYDFTSVIHANTWSEVAYSIIDITAQQIKDIKYSNDHTDSPYLGLCDKDKDSDEITQYLCCCINNKSCKPC